ncbi:thioredoxin domain-containing protein [Hymenobacter persicinus]|uniref:Thioredoxin domain-containing protein n=1 Tax=Hymenobacter persicinus TaxID=2025506 RepID=A0A4V1ZA71_9BACT|nr:thioredoxin domain-containing protein [Hymenobacter persicinus]RYU74073.1 thioredoxin domain-containing protein [Hymenobacter persicinus]
MSASTPAPTNRLSRESSPYLLQHAHNPVDWYPWGPEALERAQKEQKPILVSIGYAACHWCHVMERESFENARIAEVMNRHFVCIKVDREERPDVDQVYMDALHAMGVQGGWPLNVFLTAEAKPFYGGTYFAPRSWTQLLESIGEAYQNQNRRELDQSAEQFTQALRTSELEKYGRLVEGSVAAGKQLETLLHNLSQKFDSELGGTNRAPKFPMPSIWRFLLRAHAAAGRPDLLGQTELTLQQMAWGGLYDQAGGGFARYSTDAEWLAPHFEKMLYDNGQLVSLYAEAYQVTQNELFREVVYETVAFVERELLSPEGGFYSSLDADSEGEEGKFYVFTKDELRDLLGDEEALFSDYYNCTALGNWEHGRNILHRRTSDADWARRHELQPGVVAGLVQDWKARILTARSQRVRPGLDDKILTGWNALMLSGLVDAYRAFGDAHFLTLARRNAEFLQTKLRQGPRLRRNYKAGRATIDAFLEDYALVIQAYIGLYEVTFDAQWLREADTLTEYVLTNFTDPAEPLFFYTDQAGEALIARKKELFDNVIPASNSVMAHNLHRLGLLLDQPRYQELAAAMLGRVRDLAVQEPQHLTNWAALYLSLRQPTAEIAVVGPEAETLRHELSRHFLPNAVLAGAPAPTDALPLLRQRPAQNGRTTLYVCFNHTCQQPVLTVAEALAQLRSANSSPQ